MAYHKIHPKFRFNGHAFNKEELKEVAYSLVKEGFPYEQQIGDFLMDWLNAKDHIAMRTSGSTGEPKTVLIQKEKMVNSALATADFFGLQPNDSALLCLPAEFVAGKMMLVRALVIGLHLDCIEPSSSPLAGIRKKYDFCGMVPLQVQNSLNDLEWIKIMIIGGAPLPAPVKEQLLDKTSHVYETYGMTETLSHVAVKRVNPFPGAIDPVGPYEAGEETKSEKDCFRALRNISFSKDQRGCLIITAPEICDAPVVTNDLINLISDTAFEWLGRIDNVINSGGVKLIPEQIEVKIAPYLSGRFLVAGLPDRQLGQKLILIIEGCEEDKISLHKIASIPGIGKYQIPKEIHYLKHFVETRNGKIQRNTTIQQIFSKPA